jgi:hypothetical protein
VERHQPSKTDPKKAAKALPWVHIAISNAKRVFLGIYHSISDCWLYGIDTLGTILNHIDVDNRLLMCHTSA